MEKQDYYKTLGVDKGSTQDEIKKAYRKLVKKYHPDVNKEDGAEDKFKEVQESYEILSNESKRKAYDQYGHAGTAGFGGSSGYGGFNGYAQGTPFDMGDIFNTFFGGGGGFDFGGSQQQTRVRGSDIKYRIKLNFDESIRGGAFGVNIERDISCSYCGGTGSKTKKMKVCKTCGGSGRIQKVQRTILGSIAVNGICNDCEGSGEVPEENCSKCGGTGVKINRENEKIKIPAGAYDGMVLRLRGGGNAGPKGTPSGDLYIEIEVEPSREFERRGSDIYTKEGIKIHVAVLGGNIKVNTPYGKVTLKIPKGTESGSIFRIREKGVPILGKDGMKGDLYVRIELEIPKKLSRSEKKLWEELGAI